MSLNGLRRLGSIDSTQIYFCDVTAYAQAEIGLSTISSTLVLFDANGPVTDEIEICLRAVMLSGAVHIILTGASAYQYEDILDQMIVQSGIERLYHSTVCTYPILDFEEALNLAVCIDEQAILIVANGLKDVLAGLMDFGMQE